MDFKDKYKGTFSQVRPLSDFEPEGIYMKASERNTRPLRRVVTIGLIAALIAALSLTAAAMEVFDLWDFIHSEDEQNSTLPDDTADLDSDRLQISLSGYAYRPEAQAYKEWKQYYDSIDFSVWTQADWEAADASGLPEEAGIYGAVNEEMYEKLTEIAEKYDLELLHGLELFTPEHPAPVVTRTGETLQSSGYHYSNGSFKAECVYTTADGETVMFSLFRHPYGSLIAAGFEIWDAENWTQWGVQTKEGRQIAMGLSGEPFYDGGKPLGGNRGLMMVDLENCAVSVVLIGYEHDMVTEEEMNEIARVIDWEALAVME